ncbi:MAG: hypothetical protein LBG82_06665 [Clostridiales Family XIII bacterium]|nr:hypothetical protein [Clostridiales Family XIII bacterium]
MLLFLLGLIAVGAALLLIYYSRKPTGAMRGGAKRVQATVVPEKRYKKSEDGKVVYLFDDGKGKGDSDGSADAGEQTGKDGVTDENPKSDDDDDYLI